MYNMIIYVIVSLRRSVHDAGAASKCRVPTARGKPVSFICDVSAARPSTKTTLNE